jgi:hypothetical protein
MNPNLLLQVLQTMNTQEVTENTVGTPTLPPPFDALQSLRHLLPPREQRTVDVMIKFYELKMLIEELQNEI